jgi:hypothetical protein
MGNDVPHVRKHLAEQNRAPYLSEWKSARDSMRVASQIELAARRLSRCGQAQSFAQISANTTRRIDARQPY